MLPKNVIYYGKTEDLPEIISLRAGPLTLNYQNGEISNIYYKKIEVVQHIYANVRDRNWGTVPNRIFLEKIKKERDSFKISYDVENIQGEIIFLWHAEIAGTSNGKIVFSFSGESHSTFMTCRIGFCILHPIRTCIAKLCLVRNDSGEVQIGTFPVLIAPGEIPPFLEMHAMAYDIAPSVSANLTFEGDLFEMEDQRNWTDASYKTFCTPLRFECPRKITLGTRIAQNVTLEIIDSAMFSIEEIRNETEFVQINLGMAIKEKIPELGISLASHNQKLTTVEIKRLKALNLNHIRLEISGSDLFNESQIIYRIKQASYLDLPLELVLYLQHPENELSAILNILHKFDLNTVRWIIFEKGKYITPSTIIEYARKYIEKIDKNAIIGGGSDADFYELNSQDTPFYLMDFVCYSMNPQVHRDDIYSLIENLETPAMTVDNAIRIGSGKPVVISPITLKQRFNPVATKPVVNQNEDLIPPEVDVRQMSLFAAGWTIGSLHNLLHSRASSLTYYETTGWQGVMENESGSPLPDKFHSVPGGVFPLYHVLTDVGEFKGGSLLETTTSDPKCVVCLGMGNKEKKQLLFANLTQFNQLVIIRGMNKPVQIRLLDETNALYAMENPEEYRSNLKDAFSRDQPLKIKLMPFAIGRLISK